ncbi:MAG: cysteine hydrolase [Nitrospira sp.]|nr:cysteine hydrolase [Nitrospira sp.]
MKIKETAIMLTGFQNDFCSEEGLFYDAVKKVLTKNRVVENTVDLLERTKGKWILTIFTPILFTEDYRELNDYTVGILGAIKKAGAFKKGTKGAEMIKEFQPYIDQIIIIPGKRGLCSFGIPEMDFVLEGHGIKNVILAGLLTNICIESTARTAYDKGYTVTILKDCTACKSFMEQEFSEKYIFPLIGEIKTHDEFLEELK